jgi:hypothetical protein
MVRQEATRKLGFTITPEEEQLRYRGRTMIFLVVYRPD